MGHLSDGSCAYVIAIGSCPGALGSGWTANGNTVWRADCVHAKYPNGTSDVPSGGYYKVLAADWNSQTTTVAFFVTCNSSGQEGAIVLTFGAARAGSLDLYKRANTNPSIGNSSNVAGATFGIYNSYVAAQANGVGGLIKTIVTDGNGYATAGLNQGEYYVREREVPWPYLINNQILQYSIKPNARQSQTMYDDTTSTIRVSKKILPSRDLPVFRDITNGGKIIADVKTVVKSDGKTIQTTITAKENITDIKVRNISTSVLNNPVSSDGKYNAGTSVISSMNTGDILSFTQSVKSGCGWGNWEKLAGICSITIGDATVDMSLALPAVSLSGTQYGVYFDSSCSRLNGTLTLDSNGNGTFGTGRGQYLQPGTTYYIRETSAAAGYSVSGDIYQTTTIRNGSVNVSVADSYSTVYVTKESGTGKPLTDKISQFSLTGAKYGIFESREAAESHNPSRVAKTADGRAAIITTDKFGNATETALRAGSYFVAEIESSVTCSYGTGISGDNRQYFCYSLFYNQILFYVGIISFPQRRLRETRKNNNNPNATS